MGDAPTLDAGYNPPSLSGEEMPRTSAEGGCEPAAADTVVKIIMHVVQVLAPLAVEDVVVDDLEASEAQVQARP